MSRLSEIENEIDRLLAAQSDWTPLVRKLAAEVDELRGKLDDVRFGIGCARGQRTTQFCAEAARRDAVIDELLAMLKPPIVAHGPNDEWGAYCETCWWSGNARDVKWTGIDNECDGSCPVCGKGIEEYTGDERTAAIYARALEIAGRTE